MARRPDAGAPEWTELRGTLPGAPDTADDLVWQELVAYLAWYERAARGARVGHLVTRLTALVVAATTTVLAAAGAPGVLTASLAATIVVLEGVQQLFGFHANWIRYRSAAETLRRHGLRYAAHGAPYDTADRRTRLVEALDDVVATEGRAWVQTAQRSAAAEPSPGGGSPT